MSTITGEYVDSLVDRSTCTHPRVLIEVRDEGADVVAACTACDDHWTEAIDLVLHEPTDEERAEDEERRRAATLHPHQADPWRGEVVAPRLAADDAIEFGVRDAAILRRYERDLERGL